MIQVFCDKKGSGKTKALIDLANKKASVLSGNVVYIDDDKRAILELNRKIRFITTGEYDLKDYSNFYGFLCGILSEDYDIEAVFVDGLFNIVDGDKEDAAQLFYNIEKLANKHNIQIYINISVGKNEMPDFMKKYVA